jgi:aldehyde:ferredoxin oxidoreductase
LNIKDNVDRYKIENTTGHKLFENNIRDNVLDSLILCKLTSQVYTWKDLADYYLFATGIQVTEEELRQTGERIENLARLFNILEGKGTRKYDNLPYKIKNCPASVKNHKKGVCVSDDELQLGLDDYYTACGWTADGIPTVDRLKQIGIGALSYISEGAIATVRAQQQEEN